MKSINYDERSILERCVTLIVVDDSNRQGVVGSRPVRASLDESSAIFSPVLKFDFCDLQIFQTIQFLHLMLSSFDNFGAEFDVKCDVFLGTAC